MTDLYKQVVLIFGVLCIIMIMVVLSLGLLVMIVLVFSCGVSLLMMVCGNAHSMTVTNSMTVITMAKTMIMAQ